MSRLWVYFYIVFTVAYYVVCGFSNLTPTVKLYPDNSSVYHLLPNQSVLLDHVDVLSSAARLARILDRQLSRTELGIADYKRVLLDTLNINDDANKSNTSSSSSLSWSETASASVRKLADNIGQQFQLYASALSVAVSQTERLFQQHLRRSVSKRLTLCSEWPANDLRHSTLFGVPVDLNSPCQLSPGTPDALAFRPGIDLLKVFNSSLAGATRWQYFVSVDSSIVEYPAHAAGDWGGPHSTCPGDGTALRHIPELLATLAPHTYRLYLILDTHALQSHPSSSSPQLDTLRAAVVRILHSLPVHVEVQLAVAATVATSGGVFGTSTECRLTLAARRRLIDRVCALSGYNESIDILQTVSTVFSTVGKCLSVRCPPINNSSVDNETATILVISAANRLAVWQRFLAGNRNQSVLCMSDNVTVRLVGIVDDERDTSAASYTDVFDVLNISSAEQLDSNVLKQLLFGRDVSVEDGAFYSLPHEDTVSGDTLVSVFSPCFHLDYYVGSVAVDVDIRQILSSYLDFHSQFDSYSFLVDYRFGILVSHPALTVASWQSCPVSLATNQPEGQCPSAADPLLLYLDVGDVETQPGFASLLGDLLRLPSGVRKVNHSANSDEQIFRVYAWHRIPHTSYTLCTVYTSDRHHHQLLQLPLPVHVPAGTSAAAGLLYHRLSHQLLQYQSTAALRTAPLCRHFHQLASTSSASLYLSTRAYIASTRLSSSSSLSSLSSAPSSPTNSSSSSTAPGPAGPDIRCWPLVRPILAYLSDSSRLMAGQGLHEHVRDHVTLLSRAAPYWRRRFLATHAASPGVVRWYAATSGGVMVTYPGGPVHSDTEPSARQWFREARRWPHRLILAPPRLDPGGAGFVVTVSHQVSLSAFSPPVDFTAVLAADVTFGRIEQMVLSVLGADTCVRLSCILFDHHGYVLYHSRLLNSSTTAEQLVAASEAGGGFTAAGVYTERLHITRLEPLLANQLLQHEILVRKTTCRRYTDMTIQRMYEFNVSETSANQLVTDLSSIGEHCKHYRLTAVPGSTLLLAVVNGSCSRPAFCPCSRSSRVCLTCSAGLDRQQCECPCECRLAHWDPLMGSKDPSRRPLPLCPLVDQWGPSLLLAGQADVCGPTASGPAAGGAQWPPCIDTSCVRYTRQRHNVSAACDEVLGCVWCRMEEDGVSLLSQPHCASLERCFGGVLGAVVPRLVAPGARTVGASSRGSSSVLHMLLLCVLLGVLVLTLWRVIIWRRQRHLLDCGGNLLWRRRSHCQSPPLTLNEECEDPEPPEPAVPVAPRVGGDALLLLVPLAPLGAYRRPRELAPGSSPATSDLGYGTMTPPDTVVGEGGDRPLSPDRAVFSDRKFLPPLGGHSVLPLPSN